MGICNGEIPELSVSATSVTLKRHREDEFILRDISFKEHSPGRDGVMQCSPFPRSAFHSTLYYRKLAALLMNSLKNYVASYPCMSIFTLVKKIVFRSHSVARCIMSRAGTRLIQRQIGIRGRSHNLSHLSRFVNVMSALTNARLIKIQQMTVHL